MTDPLTPDEVLTLSRRGLWGRLAPIVREGDWSFVNKGNAPRVRSVLQERLDTLLVRMESRKASIIGIDQTTPEGARKGREYGTWKRRAGRLRRRLVDRLEWLDENFPRG